MVAVLHKNLVGLAVLGLGALILRLNGALPTPTSALPWLLGSGAIGLGLGDFLYFVAIAHIGVGRTLILGMSMPVLNAILAWLLFGETLTPTQCFGVVAVVVGGWVAESRRIARSRSDTVGILAALGCALAMAIGNLLTHPGMANTGMVSAGFWRLLGGFLGLLPLFAFRGRLRQTFSAALTKKTARLFLMPSILGTGIGMAFAMGALKYTKQGTAATLMATTPLFSIPLAAWLLGERAGWRGWCGGALVFAGLLLVVRGGQLARHAAVHPPGLHRSGRFLGNPCRSGGHHSEATQN